MKKYLFTAFAGVFLFAGIVGSQLLNHPEPTFTLPPSGAVIETPDTAKTNPVVEDAETDTNPEAPEAMPPAKRIRHGTAIEQDLANASIDLLPPGNEKSDRLRKRVEAALDGDIDGLIDLSRKINQCGRGMSSEEQIQARLHRAAESIARNPDAPIRSVRGGGGGSVQYESVEDMEADLWARFDECQVVKDVMDETLYEQVSRLAESGLPSARYLYSVWPPDQDSLIAVDALALLEYQSLALEYTWNNMHERDPLGLLAMSQSYGANRPSMFTPRNPIQSQVFRLASMKCGIDNEWLSERALNFAQGFSRFQAHNTEIPSLEEDAVALAEKFCPLETNTN